MASVNYFLTYSNHPNGTLAYTLVHPEKDGHFKIKCSIDMSKKGITANYLQLFLQHSCTESGEPTELYYDVDFPTPYYVNQTIELFTVDKTWNNKFVKLNNMYKKYLNKEN